MPPHISVIIPVLNEERTIAATIEKVRAGGECEIIVVDGGSTDQTQKRATGCDRFLCTAPGRATQQNDGAAQAEGEILFFLHADCWPDPGFDQALRGAFENEQVIAGAFSQAISNTRLPYRWLERGNAWRAQKISWIYGDQGLFVRRCVFETLGGFPDIPLMEDLYFSKRLKRHGNCVVLKHRLHVSARRWERQGIVRQTLRNWGFVALSHVGVPSKTLARWYGNVRESGP